jgi:hypothetical protein
MSGHASSRIDAGQLSRIIDWRIIIFRPPGDFVMYTLIIVIGVLSQGASIMPIGVTSQMLEKSKTWTSASWLRNSPTPQALSRISIS